jgi:hypothetical protein
VTTRFKLGPQFFEVVDLTIQDDPNLFLCVRHRLVAAGQIDDRQPTETEPEWTVEKVTLIVRAAVDHRLGHPSDRFRFYRVAPKKIKLAANAAHSFKEVKS